mgnify:CR=1 FL=1
MKATVFSKAVVMMAVVMASVMNFSASAATPADYVKNEEMTGELMTAWVPYFKLDVEYTDSEVELNYARWNSRTNGYDSYTQTTVYELNDSNAALMLASTK